MSTTAEFTEAELGLIEQALLARLRDVFGERRWLVAGGIATIVAQTTDGLLGELRIGQPNANNDAVVATATWGATPPGGLIFVTFTDAVPVGPAVAPLLVEVRSLLNAQWSLDLSEVTAASQ